MNVIERQEIAKTLRMVSRDLFQVSEIGETIWIESMDNLNVMCYITIYDGKYMIVYKGGLNDLIFHTKNQLIRYIKKDFVSDLVAGLI